MRHWIQGTDAYLWREGVIGLGQIGPDAAPEAIPLLAYLAQSDSATERYLAVQALANLGPDAGELLRALAEDEEQFIRQAAMAALKELQ
jgi:HEAT repeat protein